MPFRHLLFNRRNGAPQRAPDAQNISLDSARYFSLDAEFPTYQWPEDDYASQPGPAGYNTAMMQNPQLTKHQALSLNSPFDQSTTTLYHPSMETPHQRGSYDYDSGSLTYSDIMDTDTSSISRGSIQSSISSTSHLDVMFDTDNSSSYSLSRKPSVNSQFTRDTAATGLCPLLTGQVGQCNPNLCGPDAPCLQYVNANYIPAIEQCIPGPNHVTHLHNRPHGGQLPPTSYPQPHHPHHPQHSQHPRQRQRSDTVSGTSINVETAESERLTPTKSEKRDPPKMHRAKTDAAELSTKGHGHQTQQVKRSRARQAHSLVERKYRENLNAKIQELHLTLKRARFGKPRSFAKASSQPSHPYDEDEAGIDDMTDTEKSYKVKKSDVLIEAMDYVHATEREMHRMQEEIQQLKSHIRTMEEWMRPETMTQPMAVRQVQPSNE